MDTISGIVEDVARDKAHSLIKRLDIAGKWENMFVDTGKFVLEKYVKAGEPYLEELKQTFSLENMKELAKSMEKTDGFTFQEELQTRLGQILNGFEIPQDEADTYIHAYSDFILNTIRRKEPELYAQCHFEDVSKDISSKVDRNGESLARIEKKLDNTSLCNQEMNLQQVETIQTAAKQCYLPTDIDADLKERTENPSIGLDFFIIDDNQFKRKFKQQLHQTTIFVKGKGREETTYCLLNELLQLQDPRPIIVVKSIEDWEQLRKEIKSHILIPMFYDEIVAPEGNTTIFVYGETEPCTGHEVLELRQRKLSTVRDALRQAGANEKRIISLMRDTHGLYVPLKKYLFQGRLPNQPAWVTGLNETAKRTALLIGQWNDGNQGDRDVIEKLSGFSYEAFLSALLPYMKGEEPFVIRNKDNGGNSYCLASIEDAWELIDVCEDKPLWKNFFTEFQKVLGTAEDWFSYSRKELIEAQIKGEKPVWSGILRHGMLRTLIMYSCFKQKKEYKQEIERAVKSVFDKAHSANHWKYLALFFQELAEIDPVTVISAVEKELDSPTGLLDLFSEKTRDFISEKDYGINVLWGLETLLVQEKYVSRASRFLAELDKRIDGDRRKQLQDIFIKLLCPWYNFSALDTPEKKIETAGILLELNEKNWDYIFDSLPYNHSSVIGFLQEPLYREHVEPMSITRNILFLTTEGYLDLLLKHMDQDGDRWKRVLRISWEFSIENRQNLFLLLSNELPLMPDEERFIVKEALQKEVSRNRHYTDASWAVPEEVIQEYERLINQISFDSPEYDYVVYFADNFRDYLLHPVPYRAEQSFEKNNAICAEKQKEAIRDFQEKQYNLSKLAKLCAEYHPGNKFGCAIADYWLPNKFQYAIMEDLYTVQPSGWMAIDYANGCAKRTPEIVAPIIKEVLDNGRYDDDFIVRLYLIDTRLCKDRMPLIQNAHDVHKQLYWSREFLPYPKGETRWALRECKQYGTANSFIYLLYEICQQEIISEEELFNYLDGIELMDKRQVNKNAGYFLSELLKPVQLALIMDEANAKIIRLAQIEIIFNPVIEWENMRCFRHHIQLHPDLYLEIINILFNEDDQKEREEDQTEENRQYIENIYRLFQIAHFCPGERNGTVQKQDISQWVKEFREGLTASNRSSRFGYLLGRVLANSPVGDDGLSPCEAIRDVIEKYADDSLVRAYRTEVFNKRGMFTVTEGEEEYAIAQKYRQNAEELRIKYPHTASIYDGLYETYMAEYESEREEAEHGG